jgi:mannose-6-phosphate isomerase-like protein (cupin superfamily)
MPIIRLADVPEVAETGPDRDTLVMKKAIGSKERDPAFAMPDQTPSMSITYIKIWGRLQRITCHETDRAMYIIEGDCIARVGDGKATHVKAGDFILIPKGTPYEFKGDLTYLVINSPSYREGSDMRDPGYDGAPVRTARQPEGSKPR